MKQRQVDRQLRQEAAGWIAKLDRGLDAADRKSLDDWLAADPAHRAALVDLARLWDQLEILSELSELFPLKRRQPSIRLTPPLGLPAAAAALLLTVAGGWLAFQQLSGPEHHEPAIADESTSRSYETAIGEQSTLLLADGSSVALNTDSRIDVRFTSTERNVFLERGESFFEVAADPQRPFKVHAGGKRIESIGTAFNVFLHSRDMVEVTVVEGRVRITDAPAAGATPSTTTGRPPRHRPAMLSAGDVALGSMDRLSVQRIAPEQLDIELAWKQGMIVFKGESLAEALQEVSRYTTLKFVFDDEAVGETKVGGYFRAGDVDGLLSALEQNFAINAEYRDGDVVALSRR